MNLTDSLYIRIVNTAISYLNSNDGSGIVAFGIRDQLRMSASGDLNQMQEFIDRSKGQFVFMMLSYDLKNTISELRSHNHDGSAFPGAILWVPDTVIKVDGHEFELLQGENIEYIGELFADTIPGEKIQKNLKPRTSKSSYIDHVNALKEEIQFGNIYEVNYCQEFYAEDVAPVDFYSLYQHLNKKTKAPFSAFVEIDEFSVICASPERFIKKEGAILSSQPIKGTIRRSQNKEEDEQLKEQLRRDPKERSENVMIVDLVRNDLSKIASKNSVKVDELFGIYTFETVHQMISTISCEVNDSVSFTDMLKATFPMGSMTGAPKLSAMKLIEAHEDFRRGLYSGSIGYIDPNGNFDLNVVIRSVIYNRERNYISCSVGSAITIQSDPEYEYEECYTKINALLQGINE